MVNTSKSDSSRAAVHDAFVEMRRRREERSTPDTFLLKWYPELYEAPIEEVFAAADRLGKTSIRSGGTTYDRLPTGWVVRVSEPGRLLVPLWFLDADHEARAEQHALDNYLRTLTRRGGRP